VGGAASDQKGRVSVSELDERPDQGRFGPPPIDAYTVSCRREHGAWLVVVNTHREGERGSCRELVVGDCTLADAVEAIVTETYRVMLRG
jgi:hypothetical protein